MQFAQLNHPFYMVLNIVFLNLLQLNLLFLNLLQSGQYKCIDNIFIIIEKHTYQTVVRL